MSRMIAAFEALPHPTRLSWTSHIPTANCYLSDTESRQPKQHELLGSWSTSEPSETTTDDLPAFDLDGSQSNPQRMELVHCCEEISEQLLQIRDGLQIEDAAAGTVQLRIFGD